MRWFRPQIIREFQNHNLFWNFFSIYCDKSTYFSICTQHISQFYSTENVKYWRIEKRVSFSRLQCLAIFHFGLFIIFRLIVMCFIRNTNILVYLSSLHEIELFVCTQRGKMFRITQAFVVFQCTATNVVKIAIILNTVNNVTVSTFVGKHRIITRNSVLSKKID